MTYINNWLQNTDFSMLSEGDTECNGVAISVQDESYQFCNTLTQYMTIIGTGLSFKRTGTKEYSYERWVDTWWHDWEPND